MLKNLIAPMLLAFIPWGMAAEPVTVRFQVVDSETGAPVSDARVIVNHGPDATPVSAEMEQKNRQFQPGSLLVPTGSEVNFPNRDATQHHVYSFSPAKVFNLELFADQPKAPVVFDKPGVVEVGCNIHDQMQGFILVTDSVLTGQTDTSGMASIDLPGALSDLDQLSVSLWHPRLTNTTQTTDFTISMPEQEPVELALNLKAEPEKAGRLDGLQKRFRDL